MSLEADRTADLDEPGIQNLRRRPPACAVRAEDRSHRVRVQHVVGVDVAPDTEATHGENFAQTEIEA